MTAPSKLLMVMAGGTGGHIYPAMAVADALSAQGWRIVWLCSVGGMENQLIANKAYQKVMVHIRGVRGKGWLAYLKLPLQLNWAFWDCACAMYRFRPQLVLGMGGFVAFPGGVMAWLSRIPLLIHEQNALAGWTNKWLSRFATRTLCAFPEALPNASVVGNPVRADIANLPLPEVRFKGREGVLRLLVLGGSLGAQIFNTLLPPALASLDVNVRPQVIHQAGVKHATQLQHSYKSLGVVAQALPFIDDMAAVYAWADIVICRAGAITIAELSVVGMASVLVPFPFAVDDHQTHNARYLSAAGAALLLPQTEFNHDTIVTLLKSLNRNDCLAYANAARALGKPDATAQVVHHCLECVR